MPIFSSNSPVARRRTSFPPNAAPQPIPFAPSTKLHRILASDRISTLARKPSIKRRSTSLPQIQAVKANHSAEDFLANNGCIEEEEEMTKRVPTQVFLPFPSPSKTKSLAKHEVMKIHSENRARRERRRATKPRRRSVINLAPSLNTIGEVDSPTKSMHGSDETLAALSEECCMPAIEVSSPTALPEVDTDDSFSFVDSSAGDSSSCAWSTPTSLDEEPETPMTPEVGQKNSKFVWAPQRPIHGEFPDPLNSHPVDPEELAKAMYSASRPADLEYASAEGETSPSSVHVEVGSDPASPFPGLTGSIMGAVTPRPSVSAALAQEPAVEVEPPTPAHQVKPAMLDTILAAHNASMRRRSSAKKNDSPVMVRKPLPASITSAADEEKEPTRRGSMDSINSSTYSGDEEDEHELIFNESVGISCRSEETLVVRKSRIGMAM